MKAMENLPISEKKKMLPIVLLAPWLNSIKFDNTFGIVEKSIGDVKIVVDLDRFFQSESLMPSRREFFSLLSGDDCHKKWMELVGQRENFIPCIQVSDWTDEQVVYQIDVAKALGRGFVFRIEIDRLGVFERSLEFIKHNYNENILVIIDYGYKTKSEWLEIQLAAYIDKLIEVSPEIRFVVTGASFPNEFSEFDDFSRVKVIDERAIYSDLKGRYGNYQFFYGDWASTKPRRYDGGGGTPLPRIDFPTSQSWIIARSSENEWGFSEAARAVSRLPEWSQRPFVWGTGMIEKTALGVPGGISTGPQAIAARVNIHLYIQNNFGQDLGGASPEGEWVDPI